MAKVSAVSLAKRFGGIAKAKIGTTLDEVASKELLRQYGIPVPRGALINGINDIDKRLMGLQPPLALKVIAHGVSHKSEVGGVRLGLTSLEAVKAAILSIQSDIRINRSAIAGYLLEEMAPRGHEVVIGGITDVRFGPMLMVGLGGILVEVFDDVAFRACPVEERDAMEMIERLKGAPVLSGARGGLKADLSALVSTIVLIGGADGLLMDTRHQIRELDINPIIVSDKGAVAVDARVVVS